MEQLQLLILVLSAIVGLGLAESTTDNFIGCDIDQYYNSVDIMDRFALHIITKDMHRGVLPYTSSTKEDVWDALIELDGYVETNQQSELVHLIYRDLNVPAEPYGESDSWNREHVWPKSRGVGDKGPDFTDVHCLRPSDWNVNAARGNKLFGECGLFHDISECNVPAHSEAAYDTASDPSIWLPPADVRGDIARALMYMAIRYDADDENHSDQYDLELSDCPELNTESATSQMGYLTQLFQWHQSDPVDDFERQRNDDVCRKWQGNRNPFTDYPDLVNHFFGSESGYPGYSCNHAGTASPIPSPSSGNSNSDTCSELSPGDLMVTGFKSDNPDAVTVAALANIAADVYLYLTDNPYDGSSLGTNEGIVRVSYNGLFIYLFILCIRILITYISS